MRIDAITGCWGVGRGIRGRGAFVRRRCGFISDVHHVRSWFLFRVAAAIAGLAGGCAVPRTPYPESFNSFRSEERILAARHAAQIGDEEAVPLLVDRLEDDDAAVRMFSVLALEKLTGTRLGYDYAGDGLKRARAVERWRRYVRERSATGSAPARVIDSN